jgi:hypothetical protein
MNSAVDLHALVLGVLISAVITASLMMAHRGDGGSRRGWLVAGGVAFLLMVAGSIELLLESPRETHLATWVVGAALPVFGATGIIRGTRRMRPWLRWMIVFLTTFVLLLGGLQLGAAILPRFLR